LFWLYRNDCCRSDPASRQTANEVRLELDPANTARDSAAPFRRSDFAAAITANGSQTVNGEKGEAIRPPGNDNGENFAAETP
jgi:hypothetical protein